MMQRKVIIDCDPGIDDALAISALFSSPDIEVLGITVVGGNRPIDVVYKNALRLTKFFNKDIKTYKGDEPMERMSIVQSTYFHGENGLGGVELPYDENQLSDISATDFISQMVSKYPNEVEIVALGPLTNLAYLIRRDVDSFNKIKGIYSMGGAFSKGNITPYSEYNYYYDLPATRIVMNEVNNGKVEFHMFPLDITTKVIYDINDFKFLELEGGRWGQLVSEMFAHDYLPATYRQIHLLGCVLHDLVAAMYLIEEDLFDHPTPVSIEVDEKGQLIETIGQTKTYVHCDVDDYKLKLAYLALLFNQDVVEHYVRAINVIGSKNYF